VPSCGSHWGDAVSEPQVLSQLLNMLAPDIRSSLGELQGTLHLIADDLADRQETDMVSQRRIELVANAQERVNQFASMLSIATHLDALTRGGPKIRPERIDIQRILDRIAYQLNAERTGDAVQLDVQLAPATLAATQMVCVDATNLAQLLGYVLRFAWSTTLQSRVSAEVFCDQDRLGVRIIDHGPTMSAAELGLLFDLATWSGQLPRRLQGDDPTVRLGLNLAKSIARAINGQCDVTPHSQYGSVWTIAVPTLPISALPVDVVPAQGSRVADDVALGATTSFTGTSSKSLLLVDDSESSRLVTRALLEDLGHQVAEAANGKEALVRLRTDPLGPFDAVIMDLMMPEMDGLSAAKAIRELPTASPSLRLIALTGHNSEEEINASREAGFNDFLSKPVDRQALIQCLDPEAVSGDDFTHKVAVNEQVLAELQTMLGAPAMDRLLLQFLAELDERMSVVTSLGNGDLDDVYHNIHMIRYSADHFGFERLAESAKRLGEVRLSLDNVAFAEVVSQSPRIVYQIPAAASAAVAQMRAEIEEIQGFLQQLFAGRESGESS